MPDDESFALLGDILLLKMADKVTLCFLLLVKKKKSAELVGLKVFLG